MSTVLLADATTTTSSFHDPTDLVEEPLAFSGEGSHELSQSFSGSLEEDTAAPIPEALAPMTVTAAPTAAPLPSATPDASVAVPVVNKSGSTGDSSTVVSVTLVLVGLVILLGVILFIRRRRRNTRFIEAKFQHDPNLGTPTVSIELPPPRPSSRTSYDPMGQSHLTHNQRVSVFSNGRTGGGGSLFNTAAPVVSPTLGRSRLQPPSHAHPHASPFRPDQSTTYRLVDPTPNAVATPILQSSQPTTPVLPMTPVRLPHQPDYGNHYKPQYEISPTASADDTASMTTTAFESQLHAAGLARDTVTSVASTVQGFHDSLCDDLYQYGDGLQRERAQSRSSRTDRSRSQSRSRGHSSASASNAGVVTRPKGPSIVLEIDELLPIAPAPQPPAFSTPKTPSNKTLSFADMRAGKRAPPPPPPPPAPSSFFLTPPSSPTLSETDPFNPLMMTSVHVHESRASEDMACNRGTNTHAMIAAFSSSTSSSSAASDGSSSSFGSESSMLSAMTLSSSSTTTNLHSSHNGRIFDKPTDAAIQRLSDVSSINSDTSNVRVGSLIELKQVVEMENPEGKAKEIEI